MSEKIDSSLFYNPKSRKLLEGTYEEVVTQVGQGQSLGVFAKRPQGKGCACIRIDSKGDYTRVLRLKDSSFFESLHFFSYIAPAPILIAIA